MIDTTWRNSGLGVLVSYSDSVGRDRMTFVEIGE
jgi:hypothetical protein